MSMIRYFALSFLVLGCASASGPASHPTNQRETACIDKAQFTAGHARVTAQMQHVLSALTEMDIDAAVTATRLAAFEERSMADLFVDYPAIRSHITRAADATDSAASAMSAREISNATSFVTQASNEMDLASVAEDPGMWC